LKKEKKSFFLEKRYGVSFSNKALVRREKNNLNIDPGENPDPKKE